MNEVVLIGLLDALEATSLDDQTVAETRDELVIVEVVIPKDLRFGECTDASLGIKPLVRDSFCFLSF